MAPPGPIFIVGSGPMIGLYIARLFATHDFIYIALFSRFTSNLARNVFFVIFAVFFVSIYIYFIDVIDDIALIIVLEKTIIDINVPEVVVYNAARINYRIFEKYTSKNILLDFKIFNLDLYIIVSVMLSHL